MKLSTLFFPLCLAANVVASYLVLNAWGFENPKSYMFITHISLFLVTLYYFRCVLTIIEIPFPSIEIMYKINFAMSFFVGLMYWMMNILDKNSVNDGTVVHHFYLDFYIHGGTFILLFLENFIWHNHIQTLKCNYGCMLIISLILVAIVYVPWFIKGFAVYPFLKKYTPIEFFILPVEVAILLFIGTFIHNIITKPDNSEEKQTLISASVQ